MSLKSGNSRRARLIWTVGSVELDESSWRLRVGGRGVEIEQKPMELLLALLHRNGEVVTKEELLDLVWPGVTVVASSLPTAIAKLRRALGDDASIVETVQRLGYRIAAGCEIRCTELGDRPLIGLVAGDAVPGAPGWRLERMLARGEADDVWLARSDAGAARVFKFAETPGRLRQLKREARVGHVLAGTAYAASRFVLPIAQAFDRVPAWLAFPDAGIDLGQWFVRHGAALDREGRIALAGQAARAAAAAHAVGVLHLDLKPANLLVTDMAGGPPHVRLIDFGSSALLDLPRAPGLALTETAEPDAPSPAGTPLYRAPELIGEGTPSVASDIYALGLLLFQLVVGDLHRPLAPGWEALIDDPLLRVDIARACALDPGDRFASADTLAGHLATLEQRREAARREAEEARATEQASREAERARMRRPWVIGAGVALSLGVVAASAAAWQAARQRDEAERQTAITLAINGFLADDLLGRGDPARSGDARETLIDATHRAEPEIDRRFANAPRIAAQLYHTLARVYAQQSDWKAARIAYGKADDAFARAHLGDSEPAIVSRLQHAFMEALSYEQGSVERARALIAAERKRLGDADAADPETRVWLATAEGMVELAGGDMKVARDRFALATRLADTLPDRFDERTRNDFRQRLAFSYIRSGDGARGEALIKPLLAAQTTLLGPLNPDVLLLRMNLGQAYLFQRRFPEAVAELSAVLPLIERQLGPNHRLAQQTLAARLEAYGGMGDYRDSVADGRKLYAIALAQQGMGAFRTIAALSDLATSECRIPDTAHGIADARRAWLASRSAFGDDAALTQGVATALAQCLIEGGKNAEAAPLLVGVDRKAVADLSGDRNWGANVDLAQAEIALHAGRRAEAAAKLDAVAAAYGSPRADVFQHRKYLMLRQALHRDSIAPMSGR